MPKQKQEKQAPSESETLLSLTVDALLDLRAAFLKTGVNAITHWTQLETRMRSAERRAQDPEEWFTLMLKGLRIEGASLNSCRSSVELAKFVDSQARNRAWHELLERRWGMVMATARLTAEQRKEAKEE